MKRCSECNVIYEDTLDVCPTCGEKLEPISKSPASRATTGSSAFRERPTELSRTSYQEPQYQAYVFEQHSGNNVVINGSVAESNTQQYYQSKLTKIIQAIISGEPYQLSHTTFVTVFRVEEHTLRAYPEHARDVILYGNMQNIFAVGDDVTVAAKRTGRRLVARNVYNHSINDRIRVQPAIPALVIRLLAALMAAAVALIIYKICTVDYTAIGDAAGNLLSALLPSVLVIAAIWYGIRLLVGKKK